MNPRNRRRFWVRTTILVVILVLVFAWLGWSEQHPEHERDLRIEVQERLHTWFPEGMQLPDEQLGFIPRSQQFAADTAPQVLLLHGLDEPGNIWDTLATALDDADINGWEFRYPNDQAIEHSADLLADYWPQLETSAPLILIGHSMGGLVIRDFITRYRHPVDTEPSVRGPPIGGVILVAPPNQGSEWARLRVWLEAREWLADLQKQRFSLFAGLRDGTGAAKIDLRPDSAFLQELNQRPWPEFVPMRIIGGQLPEPTPAMHESLAALQEQTNLPTLIARIRLGWEQTSEELGDGVVPVHSLALDGQPEPILLEASHRGLLAPGALTDEPPAVDAILRILQHWQTLQGSSLDTRSSEKHSMHMHPGPYCLNLPTTDSYGIL